ncbi:MAG TPA: hypothetical protein VGE07_29660, partial [Herpetosiphonaceae bacterium]
PGRLPKTKARAAFRRLRLLRDLAALLGCGCAVAAVTATPLIAALGAGLAVILAAARLAESRRR